MTDPIQPTTGPGDGAHRQRRLARRHRRVRRDDRGEGVISAAIAVLVMAGIGALMWVGFKAIWEDTEANTRDKVAEIGR
jgi:hypothetical protein